MVRLLKLFFTIFSLFASLGIYSSEFNCKKNCIWDFVNMFDGTVNLNKSDYQTGLLEKYECNQYLQELNPLDLPSEHFKQYFLITGTLFKANAEKIVHTNIAEYEKHILVDLIKQGMNNYLWPIGATDCFEHARNLKAYMESSEFASRFKFEIVNTVKDYNLEKSLNVTQVIPMGNHYIVRATSIYTGISYLLDGYVPPMSVEEEMDVFSEIVLNTYEECVFMKMVEVKGYDLITATWAPILRSQLAKEAKAIADKCIRGESNVFFE
jgi:hypothetical protein